MSEHVKKHKLSKFFWIRLILLPLLLFSVPMGCTGGISLLSVLPKSTLPDTLNFMLNLFETEATIENNTNETLYITPITTTFNNAPRVIPQPQFIRQRDFPIKPNDSIAVRFDSADALITGIAVCRENGNCRMLPADYSNAYHLTSFDSLSELEPSWSNAIQSYPKYSLGIFILTLLSLFPILMAAAWLYTGKIEERQRNKETTSQQIYPFEGNHDDS